MLQQTLMRLAGDSLATELIASQVICNEAYRFTVVEQARAIRHELQEIILEADGAKYRASPDNLRRLLSEYFTFEKKSQPIDKYAYY